MKNPLWILVPFLFLAACAAGANPQLHTTPVCMDVALQTTPGFLHVGAGIGARSSTNVIRQRHRSREDR